MPTRLWSLRKYSYYANTYSLLLIFFNRQKIQLMEIQQIINHIVSRVRTTHNAFIQKGLDYDPQIIARATYKEIKGVDPTVDEHQFDEAIKRMHEEGLAVGNRNGLVFFDPAILGRTMAEA